MKKTKLNVNKKIMASASMLLISSLMLSSATYAWFTINKEVTVTGMELKTKVGSNLLISASADESAFSTALSQSRSALLEPVSTVNGTSFFYTVNAGADGDALSDNYTAYSEATNTNDTAALAGKSYYDNAFNQAYGITPAATAFGTAYGYVDYAFYLKATNTDQTGSVDLTKCELLYDADGDGTADTALTDKAWRVAMFVQDLNTTLATGTTPGANGGAALKTILTLSGAQNQTSGQAVTSTSALGSVTYNTAANVESGLTAGQTNYYYVVVRVWLEGEDKTCTASTYAPLTNKYTLDLEFSLNGGNDGSNSVVSNIGTAAAAAQQSTNEP